MRCGETAGATRVSASVVSLFGQVETRLILEHRLFNRLSAVFSTGLAERDYDRSINDVRRQLRGTKTCGAGLRHRDLRLSAGGGLQPTHVAGECPHGPRTVREEPRWKPGDENRWVTDDARRRTEPEWGLPRFEFRGGTTMLGEARRHGGGQPPDA